MFDYLSNIRSHQTVPCTWDLMQTIMRSVGVSSTCADIADLREKVLHGALSRTDFETRKGELKRQLPVFCFHAHFRHGHRLNADAEPSGLSMLDIDHIGPASFLSPEGDGDSAGTGLGARLMAHAQACKPIGDPATVSLLRQLGIVLVHLTPSCEGLRIVFALPEGTGLADGQRWMAERLGIARFDGACKDLARCSFAVPESYVLYLDREGLFQERHVPSAARQAAPANTPCTAREPQPVEGTPAGAPAPDDATLRLFDACTAAAGLTPDRLDIPGTRHNSLTAILSMGICRLMPQRALEAAVARRMPAYSREKDCQGLIRDFYDKYTDPNRPMSGQLRRIYTDALKADSRDADEARQETGNATADIPAPGNEDALRQQKKVLQRLPHGLRETIGDVPDAMQMPVLCAVMPLAAAYADGVTVRYCDGQTHRLGLMSIIVGPQASGKSVCKEKVNLWLRQMEEEDSRARCVEEEWKQACKARKANEKMPPDPKPLIRSVPVTISCSSLLRRLKNSHGHCLYSFGEELDTLRKTNNAGSWSVKYDIYRVGFDNGKWGQDYNSEMSESGMVEVAYNFSILGTYGALRKCFRHDNVENGLSSRVIVAEMADTAFAPMPAIRKPKAGDADAIAQAVARLCAQTGFVDTPRLRKAIGQWVEARRLEAMASGDLVKDTYRKRAAVIGFRCGAVARLLEGRESKAVTSFATLMAQYVLDHQCRLFGDGLLHEYRQASDEQERYTANGSIFDSLPPVFSIRDIQRMKGATIPRQTLYSMVFRWKKAGWVEKCGTSQWRKKEGSPNGGGKSR